MASLDCRQIQHLACVCCSCVNLCQLRWVAVGCCHPFSGSEISAVPLFSLTSCHSTSSSSSSNPSSTLSPSLPSASRPHFAVACLQLDRCRSRLMFARHSPPPSLMIFRLVHAFSPIRTSSHPVSSLLSLDLSSLLPLLFSVAFFLFLSPYPDAALTATSQRPWCTSPSLACWHCDCAPPFSLPLLNAMDLR